MNETSMCKNSKSKPTSLQFNCIIISTFFLSIRKTYMYKHKCFLNKKEIIKHILAIGHFRS